MTIQIILASLAVIWNLLPFVLLLWLWKDQPRHRYLTATLFVISVLFYALMYWSSEGSYFFVPLLIYALLIVLSTWMLASNTLFVQRLSETARCCDVRTNKLHNNRLHGDRFSPLRGYKPAREPGVGRPKENTCLLSLILS